MGVGLGDGSVLVELGDGVPVEVGDGVPVLLVGLDEAGGVVDDGDAVGVVRAREGELVGRLDRAAVEVCLPPEVRVVGTALEAAAGEVPSLTLAAGATGTEVT